MARGPARSKVGEHDPTRGAAGTGAATPARPARFCADDLTAPTPRVSDVQVTLADYVQVNFCVSPEALERWLPEDVRAERFVLPPTSGTSAASGAPARSVAFVSAVVFRDVDFRVGFAPFLRMSMGQTNYRAYVIRGGKRAAWFFGTTLDSATVWLPRTVWKMPWRRATMEFDAQWDDDDCKYYHHRAEGPSGAARLTLGASREDLDMLPGFVDAEDMSVILTHPLTGLFAKSRGGETAQYGVWHPRLTPRFVPATSVEQARFELYEELGLTTPGQAPHSVFVQPAIDYLIRLPPRRPDSI